MTTLVPAVARMVAVTAGQRAWDAHQSRLDKWSYRTVVRVKPGNVREVTRRRNWAVWALLWLHLPIGYLGVLALYLIATVWGHPLGCAFLLFTAAVAAFWRWVGAM